MKNCSRREIIRVDRLHRIGRKLQNIGSLGRNAAGPVRWVGPETIRAGAVPDAQGAGRDDRQNNVIVARAAGVADLQDCIAVGYGGAFRETGERAANGVSLIVIQNHELLAEIGLETERGHEGSVAKRHSAGDVELVIS